MAPKFFKEPNGEIYMQLKKQVSLFQKLCFEPVSYQRTILTHFHDWYISVEITFCLLILH